jgi:hypothetical protein
VYGGSGLRFTIVLLKKEKNMADNTTSIEGVETGSALVKDPPRSLAIAGKGIKTGADFANLMGALMSDLIDGRVTPNVGNATCNAGGKLLKVVEMQFKYGTQGAGQEKTLRLTVGADEG